MLCDTYQCEGKASDKVHKEPCAEVVRGNVTGVIDKDTTVYKGGHKRESNVQEEGSL